MPDWPVAKNKHRLSNPERIGDRLFPLGNQTVANVFTIRFKDVGDSCVKQESNEVDTGEQ